MSRWKVIAFAGLPLWLLGCTSPQLQPKKPVSGGLVNRTRLADRDAVARYLPPDIWLDTPLDCERPRGTVEEALIKVGARVTDDGKLRSAAGKDIYFEITAPTPNPPTPNATAAGLEHRRDLEARYTVITISRRLG